MQKNIHKFGGDSSRVTVIGQFAGAGIIMHQVTAYGGLKPRASFSQAILQSPGVLPVVTKAAQEAIYQKTLPHASLVTGQNITTVQQLRGLTAEQVYAVNYITIAQSPHGIFTFGPSIDGQIVPELPREALLRGHFDENLKVMVGQTKDGGTLFANPFITDDAAFAKYVRSAFPSATQETIDYITQALYPPVFDGSNSYTTQFERTSLLGAEVYFTCNTRFLDLALNNETYCTLLSIFHSLRFSVWYNQGNLTSY